MNVVAERYVRRPAVSPRASRSASTVAWVVVAVGAACWLALVSPASGVASALLLLVLVLTYARPAFGVAALLVSVPVQDSLPFQVGTYETTLTRCVLVAVVLAWGAEMSVQRRWTQRLPSLAFPFVFVVVCLVLSVGEVRDMNAWAGETYRWGVGFVAYLVAATSIRGRGDIVLVIGALAAGVAGSALVAIYQAVEGVGPASFTQRGVTRAYAAFGEPNPFAGYLEMAVLPLLAFAFVGSRWSVTGRNRVARLLVLWLPIALGLVALLLSQSRGGVLGFACGAAVIVWYAWPRLGRPLVLGAACVAFLVAVGPLGSGIREVTGIDRLAADERVLVTPSNFAVQERLAHWGAALNMWETHPWTGIGAGQFDERFREYTPSWRFRIPRGHAHSAYLQAAAQAGAAGLVAYVTLLGCAWRSASRGLRGVRVDHRAGAVAALAVTAAVAVHGFFDYLHVLSLGIVLSTVWALAEVFGAEDEAVIDGHH